MDIVVYLALAVLAAVFLFSLFILIVMCHRRYEYNRLLLTHSLRFSKLHQDNFDDFIQLGPHISQKLNNNQWVEEVSGILQNCVAVLKLCHLLTEKMSKIPLNQISSQLNELICQGTTRVVPRFDILLRSMAAKNVDIRVIEARVSALVTACWSLVTPFYMLSPKHKDALGIIVKEMELYHAQLLMALEQVEHDDIMPSVSSALPVASDKRELSTEALEKGDNRPESEKSLATSKIATSKSTYSQTQSSSVSYAATPLKQQTEFDKRDAVNDLSSPLIRNGIKLRSKVDETTKELLSDEAPADPSSS